MPHRYHPPRCWFQMSLRSSLFQLAQYAAAATTAMVATVITWRWW